MSFIFSSSRTAECDCLIKHHVQNLFTQPLMFYAMPRGHYYILEMGQITRIVYVCFLNLNYISNGKSKIALFEIYEQTIRIMNDFINLTEGQIMSDDNLRQVIQD